MRLPAAEPSRAGIPGLGGSSRPCDVRGTSDKVQISLKCPVCIHVGTAYVREASDYGWMRGDREVSVVSMPEGFVAVHREGSSWNGSFDIDCVEDGVSAISRA